MIFYWISQFLILFILVVQLLVSPAICVLDVTWWSSVAQLSTAMTGAFNKKTCWELKGLSPGQSNICELFDDHMPAIGAGAKGAIAVAFFIACIYIVEKYVSEIIWRVVNLAEVNAMWKIMASRASKSKDEKGVITQR